MDKKNNKLLWSKGDGNHLAKGLMHYLAGDDVILDRELFLYDIKATKAHIIGLQYIDLINEQEKNAFLESLDCLAELFESGKFTLDESFEDGHSAIELYLIEQLGELGEKAHTGRSRNDQVLTCIRLYMIDQLKQIKYFVIESAQLLLDKCDLHKNSLMPGYTHLQRAMPNTVAVWLAGLAESLIDDVVLINSTLRQLECSPLGTAAGFGVSLPLARESVAEEMGFSRVQINPVYAQNSRGKFELIALQTLYHVMLDVRRFAWDLSLYMTEEFGFIGLSKSHTTGSSIMPNKANPDVVELMRAKLSIVEAAMQQIQSLMSLPSGYHRDLQMSKEPLIKGIKVTKATLELLPGLINALKFDKKKMRDAVNEPMLATDKALLQVKNGVSFRSAYLSAKDLNPEQGGLSIDDSIRSRVSLGGAANLGLNVMQERLNELL